jgi:hypothetical protein
MGKRVVVVFTFLAVAVFQCLRAPHSSEPPRFYAAAPPPMVAFQHRMPPPHMREPTDRVLDQDWTSASWNYDTPYTQEDVQRRIIERLFRKPPAGPALEDPSKDAALQAAAQEVRDIAATFGKPEGEFADKWIKQVMATEDPKARLDIIDECFVNMELNCQGLEDALRRFRLLLAPHTALVKEAKKEVLYQAGRQDDMKQAFVDDWMKKVEKGERAEDPSDVLDECLISTSMGGPRSKECFEFEEALRNYQAAAGIWAAGSSMPKDLGKTAQDQRRIADMKKDIK